MDTADIKATRLQKQNLDSAAHTSRLQRNERVSHKYKTMWENYCDTLVTRMHLNMCRDMTAFNEFCRLS